MVKSSKPVVLITGVSSGIGLAAATLFSEKGWIVVGTVRDNKTTSLTGLSIDIQSAEMNNPDDLKRVITQLDKSYGRLDALVCNAGYALMGPLDSLDYDQIRDQFLTNTVAPAELSRLALPVMKKNGAGTIVFVSSIVGRIGLPGYSMYSSSKWALEGLAESLTTELFQTGVGVKLIEPSGVNTAFWTSLKRGSSRKWNNTELGRAGNETERTDHGLSAERVAKEIYRATTDTTHKLHFPLGQTRLVVLAKRVVPERIFLYAVRRSMR
jgi:short-subunit dehydrogenase